MASDLRKRRFPKLVAPYLEVNAAPGFACCKPTVGLPRNVAEPVVDMLFRAAATAHSIIAITGTNGKTTIPALPPTLFVPRLKSRLYYIRWCIYSKPVNDAGRLYRARCSAVCFKRSNGRFCGIGMCPWRYIKGRFGVRHCNVDHRNQRSGRSFRPGGINR